MRLSIITSSLIALGAAAPTFQGPTHLADLRSPLHIIKRGSGTAVEAAPGVKARHVGQSGGGFGGHKRGVEERYVSHGGDNNNFPGSQSSPPPSPDSGSVLEARRVGQSGGGFGGHKRAETEESESVLEARRVGQSGGGFGGHKRAETEESESALEARRVGQSGGGFGGHKRAEVEESESVLEARRVGQSGGGFGGHKRDVEARGNWKWPAGRHGNGPPQGNTGFPQGNTGNPQGNSQKFQQPQANSQQPQANFQQPQANFQQPQANFQQPQANFQQPQANFQQPQANFQGNQFNANSNPAVPQNTGTETANIQINGGQSTPVPMGQLTTMNTNGPVTSMSTDKGNCMPIKPGTSSSPAQLMSNAVFSAGNPINANSVGPLSQRNQILVWCQPARFDTSAL